VGVELPTVTPPPLAILVHLSAVAPGGLLQTQLVCWTQLTQHGSANPPVSQLSVILLPSPQISWQIMFPPTFLGCVPGAHCVQTEAL